MLVKILRYFRIKDWLHILGVPALGFVYNPNFNLLSIEFVSVLLLSSLGLAAAYSLDATYNKKSKLLPAITTSIIGLIYALFLNLTVFFLSLTAALIVVAYIAPPFRFKSIPIVVTISNSLVFAILFLVGYSILSDLNMNALLVAAFIGMATFPAQLVHEIAHFSKDKKKRLITTPIKFGLKFTRFLILISLISLVIWSFFLYIYGNFLILFPILSIGFSVFFYIILKFVKNTAKARLYIRYLSIALGLLLLTIFLLRI